MTALTVRQLRDYLNTITDEKDLDAPCIMPKQDALNKIMYVFEEVCPGATEMITLGPAPEYIENDNRGENKHIEMRALLIAPHWIHSDEVQETENKKILN